MCLCIRLYNSQSMQPSVLHQVETLKLKKLKQNTHQLYFNSKVPSSNWRKNKSSQLLIARKRIGEFFEPTKEKQVKNPYTLIDGIDVYSNHENSEAVKVINLHTNHYNYVIHCQPIEHLTVSKEFSSKKSTLETERILISILKPDYIAYTNSN